MRWFMLTAAVLVSSSSFAAGKPCSQLFSELEKSNSDRAPASAEDARHYVLQQLAKESDVEFLRVVSARFLNAAFASAADRDKQVQGVATLVKRRADAKKILTDCIPD